MNETKRKALAAQLAEGSLVLLKNEGGLLPLAPGQIVAVFGRTQIGTLFSGNGSGGANVAGCQTLLAACEEAGLVPEPLLKGFYEYKLAAEPVTEADEFDWTKVSEMVNSGVMYEIFGRYRPPLEEFAIPDTLLYQAAEKTDTALLVLGRNAGGEECDRHLAGDYLLTASEQKLLDSVCTYFAHVAVVLNTNGQIDLAWLRRYPRVQALLFAGIPGEQGAGAIARVLTGEVAPSGKLAFTVATQYEDYPSAAHFSWDKDHLENILSYDDYGLSAAENGSAGFAKSPVTVYWENIYNGYRYFDTFQKPVLFPFGFGLSYTSFALGKAAVERTADGLRLRVTVRNTGECPGKEVVQVYLARESAAQLERPAQELKGFAKTGLLASGTAQEVSIDLPWRALASYDEAAAAWVIEGGDYLLKVGVSSRDNAPAVRLRAAGDIVLERCCDRLGLAECNRGKLDFLRQKNVPVQNATPVDLETLVLDPAQFPAAPAPRQAVAPAIPAALQALTDEELAALCVGYGPGTPFAAVGDRRDPPTVYAADGTPLTENDHPTGYDGYVSPSIAKAGIHSIFYKDGPAGVGGVAWPTEMLLACSFDSALWQAFGEAVGSECAEQGINVWLAPAVNLHRDPLCGRNFEYFSEDPLLTGLAACAVARGVRRRGVLVCPKHMAVNEQETFRRGSARRQLDAVDSILPARALRELYLLPFEMLVRRGDVRCLMTSFNKINGVFAGGSRALCTDILRGEWGFAGAVVTDWGDMDVVVDGADAVAAGNDIVMPGGPPVIRQLLDGLRTGHLTRADLLTAAAHLLALLKAARNENKLMTSSTNHWLASMPTHPV